MSSKSRQRLQTLLHCRRQVMPMQSAKRLPGDERIRGVAVVAVAAVVIAGAAEADVGGARAVA